MRRFLDGHGGSAYAEFPTGNGKVDPSTVLRLRSGCSSGQAILMRYAGQTYGLEVKSYRTPRQYREALQQAAAYGQQLGPVLSGVEGLTEITLAFFVEQVDDASRQKYEVRYTDEETGVEVIPVLVATG
jgi:hypothetical protein